MPTFLFALSSAIAIILLSEPGLPLWAARAAHLAVFATFGGAFGWVATDKVTEWWDRRKRSARSQTDGDALRDFPPAHVINDAATRILQTITPTYGSVLSVATLAEKIGASREVTTYALLRLNDQRMAHPSGNRELWHIGPRYRPRDGAPF